MPRATHAGRTPDNPVSYPFEGRGGVTVHRQRSGEPLRTFRGPEPGMSVREVAVRV